MSEAASAQKEAEEEAGVRGKIDPEPLTTYLHAEGLTMRAFLLRVTGEGHRREAKRSSPRWFDPETAKAKLTKGRKKVLW